jgi:serine/threonine protein kinase
MQYIDGESLASLLERERRLTPVKVVTLGCHICAALEAAHRKRIIHRDIKPQNIMLEKTGRVVVTDFGIAKDYDLTTLTVTGDVFGTVRYMSPEQCQGRNVDKRTDIYSIGVMLYEMLTGEAPFQGNVASIMQQHILRQPEWPGRNVNIPIELQKTIQKALAKNPAERYQSAGEFARSLTALLPQPQTVEPVPRPIRQPGQRKQSLPGSVEPIRRQKVAKIPWQIPTLVGGFTLLITVIWFLILFGLQQHSPIQPPTGPVTPPTPNKHDEGDSPVNIKKLNPAFVIPYKEPQKEPWIGIKVEDAIGLGSGKSQKRYVASSVLVSKVEAKSPADKSGIRRGDRILKINDREIRTPKDYKDAIDGVEIGSEIKVDICRGWNEKQTLYIKVGTEISKRESQ